MRFQSTTGKKFCPERYEVTVLSGRHTCGSGAKAERDGGDEAVGANLAPHAAVASRPLAPSAPPVAVVATVASSSARTRYGVVGRCNSRAAVVAAAAAAAATDPSSLPQCAGSRPLMAGAVESGARTSGGARGLAPYMRRRRSRCRSRCC